MSKPGPAPSPVTLNPEFRAQLEQVSAKNTTSHRSVVRARIALLAEQGVGTAEIARRVGITDRSVRMWKRRFQHEQTLKTLEDRPRSGRPLRVPVAVRCEVIALACSRPEDSKAAFRDVWTRAALRAAVVAATGFVLSLTEIGRILRYENLRPHLVKYWLTSQDPDFAAKAGRICDLYLCPPPETTVICIDEKPIQVLGRKYPSKVASDGKVLKEYEYIRRGVCCLLAAFNVRTGEVLGKMVDQRTAAETVEFLEDVAAAHPTGNVVIVWDNLNTHYDGATKRWTDFNARHGGRFSFVYTPIHASWMNQVEIWFSNLQRRIITHADFASVASAKARILGFIDHWNAVEAHPYRWTWRYRSRQADGRKAA